ncbi:kinesin-like protein KIN-6 isoform X1 [Dioscorea cayenensis subsp. rotundata]|uniref:Kinesin-like protein KIN-6 isoform X1 n=1 Tax=Dioscorea cayennensis subsp. rotundata TaxID=55577 RepID=A0AB40CD60_DIOCR|nr:kinesin-like protein KIN-6 isoform X1 [Dioscorea cayenensis subsp. rotundata]
MEHQSPCPPTTVRRNPHRKARKTPSTLPPRDPPPSAPSTIAPFPIDELLHADPPPDPPHKSQSLSEKLNVFLRIRPLDIVPPKLGKNPSAAALKKKGKGKSPNNLKGRNKNVCLVMNDSSSVTLSAPISALESKRAKSEVYDGFSHVFPSDSIQKEVYERVMDPLVEGFMDGKSALLVALGPTGSGKTHTMFGCPRDPGMVPRALQKIFSHLNESGDSHPSRSYYLSMFEIYSEWGKSERILDLSPNGVELSLQQSSVKGLQEVMACNLTQAESLIAHGMLKRATAATNANNQSSRSQCIINIRNDLRNFDGKKEFLSSGAVLTIADLAGAEKARKTGNQGTRLLESNFINNTSMVFGLCLRSLLEHQKNPKKPLQKHFKNSLLTRYLREYLEGKKRTTLILTVKPGEDDYLDTSFLLRQASPYMKIKYSNLEELPNFPSLKRSTTHSGSEHLKRRKFNGSDTSLVNAVKNDNDEVDGNRASEKEAKYEKLQQKANASPKSGRSAHMSMERLEDLHTEAQRARNEKIMLGFAKALWNVLKEYKQKLTESDKDAEKLRCALRKEKASVSKLEKELEELRSCCSCCKHPSIDDSPPKEEPLSGFSAMGSPMKPLVQESTKCIDIVHEYNHISMEYHSDTLESRTSTDVSKEWAEHGGEGFGANNILLDEISSGDNVGSFSSPMVLGTVHTEENEMIAQMVDSFSNIKGDEECGSFPFGGECLPQQTEVKPTDQKGENLPVNNHRVADLEETNIQGQHLVSTIAGLSGSEHSDNIDRSSPPTVNSGENEKAVTCNTQNSSLSMDGEIMKRNPKVSSSISKSHPSVVKHDGLADECKVRETSAKIQSPASKPPNSMKPRTRKLLPSSAMLLKEFNSLEIDAENAKENKGKSSTKGMERSQGSISLLRLLNSNVNR